MFKMFPLFTGMGRNRTKTNVLSIMLGNSLCSAFVYLIATCAHYYLLYIWPAATPLSNEDTPGASRDSLTAKEIGSWQVSVLRLEMFDLLKQS